MSASKSNLCLKQKKAWETYKLVKLLYIERMEAGRRKKYVDFEQMTWVTSKFMKLLLFASLTFCSELSYFILMDNEILFGIMKYLARNKIENALTLKISPIQTFYFHTILISKSHTHTTSYVGGKSYPELKKENWLLNSNLCSIGFEQGHAPYRPQQDLGISRDPGIELKSRSRDFAK